MPKHAIIMYMKAIKVSSMLLVAALFFSCNSEKNEVERIAQAYLDAETNYRIAEARNYASDDFMPLLDRIEHFVVPHMDPDTLQSYLPNKVKISDIRMFADTTAIVSFHSSNPRQETDAQIKMRKTDGEWKVVAQGTTVE